MKSFSNGGTGGGGGNSSSTQAKLDFFANINKVPKEPPALPPEMKPTSNATPTSLDVLSQLERHIYKMELDTKANEHFPDDATNTSATTTMTQIETNRMKFNNRYGDHENLLNTGISNVASGTALCYDADNDDDPEPHGGFKRASESRNSTIAVSGGGTTSGAGGAISKVKKPISRTVSDTKNAETTVKIMRMGIKKMDDGGGAQSTATTTTTATSSATKPIVLMSPLTSKKKEDTILLEHEKISLNARSRAIAQMQQQQQQPKTNVALQPRRQIDRETLRHTVTQPNGGGGASASVPRPRDRSAQVNFACDHFCICDACVSASVCTSHRWESKQSHVSRVLVTIQNAHTHTMRSIIFIYRYIVEMVQASIRLH